MILVLDNRDSFTFNLVQAFQALGEKVEVRHANGRPSDAESDVDALLELTPTHIVIGPGPGPPDEAHVSLALLRREHPVPVLGICLGHQALGVAFGAAMRRAPELVHGRTVAVQHDGRGLFAGIPSPTHVTRYNSLSLVPESVPACLEVSATSDDGDIMALRHRTRPIASVQFHPESILSSDGPRLLRNFVRAPVN